MAEHGLRNFSLGAIFGVVAELTTHAWVHYYQAGTNFATHLAASLIPVFSAVGSFLDPITATLGLSYLFKTAAGAVAQPLGGTSAMDAVLGL